MRWRNFFRGKNKPCPSTSKHPGRGFLRDRPNVQGISYLSYIYTPTRTRMTYIESTWDIWTHTCWKFLGTLDGAFFPLFWRLIKNGFKEK